MNSAKLHAVGLVLAAAVAAYVIDGVVLEAVRREVLHWPAVVEGLVTGAVVLAIWRFAGTPAATAAGLGVAAVIVLAGVSGLLPAALHFSQIPTGWAVMLALAARLLASQAAPTRRRLDQPATDWPQGPGRPAGAATPSGPSARLAAGADAGAHLTTAP